MWIYCKIELIPVIKAEFSASLLQSSVSHDPSEIIYADFLIIINVENSCAAQYFCGNCDTFKFSGFFAEYKV